MAVENLENCDEQGHAKSLPKSQTPCILAPWEFCETDPTPKQEQNFASEITQRQLKK